jgi:hypothetical protein
MEYLKKLTLFLESSYFFISIYGFFCSACLKMSTEKKMQTVCIMKKLCVFLKNNVFSWKTCGFFVSRLDEDLPIEMMRSNLFLNSSLWKTATSPVKTVMFFKPSSLARDSMNSRWVAELLCSSSHEKICHTFSLRNTCVFLITVALLQLSLGKVMSGKVGLIHYLKQKETKKKSSTAKKSMELKRLCGRIIEITIVLNFCNRDPLLGREDSLCITKTNVK